MGRVIAPLRRIPFALALLLAMVGVGWLSGAHLQPLQPSWLARLGFASSDLLSLEFERIAISAVATHGGAVFWRALLAVALFVGAAEWRFGTRRTALLFCASHILTLLVVAPLVALGLAAWQPMLAQLLHTTRDVGPSAGYFGCLALLCFGLPTRSKRWAGIAVQTLLCATLAGSWARTHVDPTGLSAALAHAVAFPIGWVLATVGAGRSPRTEADAPSARCVSRFPMRRSRHARGRGAGT